MADEERELRERDEEERERALPDPDQVPTSVIGLDGLLAVVVAGTVLVLISGYAWHHIGAALVVAVGLVAIAIVARLILRKEHDAHRVD